MGLLGNGNDQQKPLFRKWVRSQLKDGVSVEDIKTPVECVRISSSGEWMLIEGIDATALINMDSKVGAKLWETLTQFEGELKVLDIVPAKGKLGFDLEPSTTANGIWEYDEAEETLTCSIVGKSTVKKKSTSLSKLSLDSMKPNTPPKK